MKILKTASGKKTIKISKREWQNIGKKAGWIKKAYFGGNTEYVELGSTPAGEDCVQVGSEDYHRLSKIEGRAYLNQLRRMFPDMPTGVRLTLKSFPHDFGTYHEAAIIYSMDDEQAEDFAFNVQNNIPEYWDSEAKSELQSQGYFDSIRQAKMGKKIKISKKQKKKLSKISDTQTIVQTPDRIENLRNIANFMVDNCKRDESPLMNKLWGYGQQLLIIAEELDNKLKLTNFRSVEDPNWEE